MTKEQWNDAEKLFGLYNPVRLKVDDYELTIYMAKKKMKLFVGFWVNGKWDGKWLMEDCEERRRFHKLITRKMYKPAEIQKWEKLVGKRKCKEQGLYKSYTYYSPFWPSFRAFKSHLIKNNKEISLLNRFQEC